MASTLPRPRRLLFLADVLIAPSALYAASCAAAAPPGVAVALQDVHTAKGLGAFTGSHTVDQVVGASTSRP